MASSWPVDRCFLHQTPWQVPLEVRWPEDDRYASVHEELCARGETVMCRDLSEGLVLILLDCGQ